MPQTWQAHLEIAKAIRTLAAQHEERQPQGRIAIVPPLNTRELDAEIVRNIFHELRKAGRILLQPPTPTVGCGTRSTDYLRCRRQRLLRISLMRSADLMRSHKYAEAIAACKQELSANPNYFKAMDRMASALLALEKYEEALPLFERLDAYWKGLEIAPGSPGRQEDISCLYWFLGNRQKAIALMRGLVDGILDRSINYGDAAGGMKQGLLLYYMAVTDSQPDQAACALDYMRNRLDRLKRLLPAGVPIKSWPVPVARYYLDDLAFDELLVFATGQRELPEAIAAARVELMSRRRLCVALFHDGARSRAHGAEDQCLARMRECYALEDPLIEPEWYLARYEVEQASAQAG